MRHYPPPPSKYIIIEHNNHFAIKKRVKKDVIKNNVFGVEFKRSTYKYEYILNENVVIGALGLLDSDIKKFNTFEDSKKYIDEVLKKQEIIYHYID